MSNCPRCTRPAPTGHVYDSLDCKSVHRDSYHYLASTLAGGAIDTHPLTASQVTTVTAQRDSLNASLASITPSSDGTEPY